MDSVTHVVLGACIGEAMLGKKLGRKAMLWGALAQSLPDIDFLASIWLKTTDDLLAHRGITHSLFFALLASLLLATIAERWHRPHNIPYKRYFLFFLAELLTHLFIDSFNAYTIALFAPFSYQRFTFNTIFVADPLFTIVPLCAAIALLLLKRKAAGRKAWWRAGIVVPAIYLLLCCINKLIVDNKVEKGLQKRRLSTTEYFTTPTSFNNLLWFAAAKTDSGYYVSHVSVFDSKNIAFTFFPNHNELLNKAPDKDDVKKLKKFAQGYYTLEQWNDTLVFNILRFGQEAGWIYPRSHFIFHYYLNPGFDNKLVVQRGRFERWDDYALQQMFKRMVGK